LCGDGKLLPPVIFTNSRKVVIDPDDERRLHIVYMPKLNKPNTQTTLKYLDLMDELLHDSHVIVDPGNEFVNSEVKTWFANHNSSLHILAASGGAYINPCDNGFNATLIREYYKQQPRNWKQKVKIILDSYFAAKEETISRNVYYYTTDQGNVMWIIL
jgi:hypothetical protein